jgi:hypothetical protein
MVLVEFGVEPRLPQKRTHLTPEQKISSCAAAQQVLLHGHRPPRGELLHPVPCILPGGDFQPVRAVSPAQ